MMKLVWCKSGRKLAIAAGLAILLGLASSRQIKADLVTWNGVGTPTNSTLAVDVTAIFSHVGSDMHIDLKNNMTGTDPLQILTGLFWDVDGSAPVGTSFGSAVVGTGSKLFTTATVGTAGANLKNGFTTPSGAGKGWKYGAPPGLEDGTAFQFGVGASGLTGAFSGLGNEDWGIIGPNSNLAATNLNNKLPLVKSTSSDPSLASFVITGFNVNAAKVKDVRFVFGSAGNVHIQGALNAVPEPCSMALTAGGLGILGLVQRRRRHAAATTVTQA